MGPGFTVLQPAKSLELDTISLVNSEAPLFTGDFQFETSSFVPLLLLTFYFLIFLFTCFWLLWAFAAVRGLLMAAASHVVGHRLELP